MTLTPVPFDRFGGLDLRSDPQEVGAERALSCVNVTRDHLGRLRTRDGFTTRYNSGVAAGVVDLYPVSTDVVLAACSASKVRAVDVGAGVSLADVALTAGSTTFTAAGTGVYFGDTTTTQIRKYSGGAFSSPAGLAAYEANYLAVQPLDDRLVIADANSTSKLWFSDVASPETGHAANFLELTPGDGEVITGLAVFGTELFAFKQTKFFVFTGNSTDSTGGAIFNYRMVDMGVGCIKYLPFKLTAVHETGVYFIAPDGVYRTTGGLPVKVSKAIDPMFTGMNLPVPAPFSSVVSTPLTNNFHLSVARGSLYLFGLSFSNTPLTFVMDLATGEWTCHDWPIYSVLDGSVMADDANFRGSLVLGGAISNSGIVAKSNSTYTDDAGTAITWHHQSGFQDFNYPGNVKGTRRSELWGSGTPTLAVYTDHGSTDANAGTVTLGTAPAVAKGHHTKSYRGTLFSHRISGTSAATVHRVIHHLGFVRP